MPNKVYWGILIVLGVATAIAVWKAESDNRRERRDADAFRRIANEQQEEWL